MRDVVYTIGKSFRISHGYFSNTILKDMDVVPMQATSEYMNKQNILFRSAPSGFVLLFCEGVTDKTANEKLRFWIRFTDPYFYHYTEGPLGNNNGEAFFLTTDQLSGTTDDSAEVLQNEWTTIKLYPPYFEYPVSEGITEVTVSGQEDGKIYFSSSVDASKVQSIPIDLTGAPDGFYTLKAGDANQSFFMCRESVPVNTAMLFELDLAKDGASYMLEFSPRQLRWQYKLIPPVNQQSEKTYTIKAANGTGFSSGTTTTKSTEIISDAPITLLQVPGVKLQLLASNGSSGGAQKVLIPDLTSPSPKTLKKGLPGNPDQLYTETYVYL